MPVLTEAELRIVADVSPPGDLVTQKATVMYPAAHSGAHYLGAMNVGEMRSSNLSRRPDQLRDIAEKLLRLASGADPAIRDRLVVHASELFDQAQQIEAGSADDDDPLIKSSPRQGRAWTIEPKNNRL